MATATLPGPVDFVLIEFPADATTASTAEALTRLVDAGTVLIYDVVLIRKNGGGRSDRVDLGGQVENDGTGFEAFAGAQSGLFDDEDIALAAEVLEPGTSALLLAYENAWAVPFVTAAHGAGGKLVASERIPAQRLIDALDLAESAA